MIIRLHVTETEYDTIMSCLRDRQRGEIAAASTSAQMKHGATMLLEKLRKQEQNQDFMETVNRRAVHIAAVIFQAAGLCRYEDNKCRRLDRSEAGCVKCMELWLLQKARKELNEE